MIKHFAIVTLCILSLTSSAQNIRTIQLQPKHNLKTQSFIVRLGQTLVLSFDDLDGDGKEYQYKIEHMTHDWKPSTLTSNQYIDGFNQNEILHFSNSFNTLQSYTHYSVEIPNQNTRITKSGNYLISVLDAYDNLIFTRKCVFYEDKTTVGIAAFRSRNTNTINEQQTVQFSVNHPTVQINNPSAEIKVVLFQNHNWNTAITNIQPNFIQPNRLLYNHTLKTNFWGGNEFLNFDTKYLKNTSLNIAKIAENDLVHSYLYPNSPRINNIYTYNPDINGQFIVRSADAGISPAATNTEADYSIVHFSLDVYEPYSDKKVFVYGAFNNYQLSEENRMTFDKNSNSYQIEIPFKQGFYNYSFVTLSDNQNINLHEIDGSFYQTENQYTVIIYFKPFGGIYDQVIGVGNGYFNQNR